MNLLPLPARLCILFPHRYCIYATNNGGRFGVPGNCFVDIQTPRYGVLACLRACLRERERESERETRTRFTLAVCLAGRLGWLGPLEGFCFLPEVSYEGGRGLGYLTGESRT